MGTQRFSEMKYFHRLGTLEKYERLKVTALNLFYPTASPSPKSRFRIMAQSQLGKGMACLPVGRDEACSLEITNINALD